MLLIIGLKFKTKTQKMNSWDDRGVVLNKCSYKCGHTVTFRLVSEFANHWFNGCQVNKLEHCQVSCKTCIDTTKNNKPTKSYKKS